MSIQVRINSVKVIHSSIIACDSVTFRSDERVDENTSFNDVHGFQMDAPEMMGKKIQQLGLCILTMNRKFLSPRENRTSKGQAKESINKFLG